ncbi:hypothetical protein HMI54_009697 [Coelomomyces lativittatus]|nr:hypothetical protein HMI55_004639 [Coelomomyces lativittatus]KAJ1501767.1 hypothetical protein HMI54_009697 [Coelomomyces lativittatus]KAJ1503731.1 hypothetical protein HMI56_001979 [Coelomomyces lativittatus]
MMLLLFLLIVLQFTCVPAWTFPTSPENRYHYPLAHPYTMPQTMKHEWRHWENVLLMDEVSYTTSRFMFSIGEQQIQIISSQPCKAWQIFFGFVAASLETNQRDERFKTLSLTERLEFINQNLSAIFPALLPGGFIDSYFGPNGKKLLTKVINSNPNLLNQQQGVIYDILTPFYTEFKSSSNSCLYKDKFKKKNGITYFDYLLFHSLLIHLDPKEGYLSTLYDGCFEYSDDWLPTVLQHCVLGNIANQRIQLQKNGTNYETLIRMVVEQKRKKEQEYIRKFQAGAVNNAG